jgi:hypothetical protein
LRQGRQPGIAKAVRNGAAACRPATMADRPARRIAAMGDNAGDGIGSTTGTTPIARDRAGGGDSAATQAERGSIGEQS